MTLNYLLRFWVLLLLGGARFSCSFIPLTRHMVAKSITNYGDMAMYANVFEKLDKKHCLNMTAIGGSVTAGHWNHSLLPEASRWPELFARMLNDKFPCGGEGHRITNVGRPGTSSNWWIQEIVGHQEDFVRGSDIVFLETAVNQVAIREVAQKDDEILMSLITTQTNRVIKPTADGEIVRGFTGVATMWIIGSTRRFTGVWTGVPWERTSDAMYALLPVAQHHGVPMISAIDALGPFPTVELQAWFNNTWYKGDKVHPATWGHKVIAELMMAYFEMAFEHTRLFQMYDIPKSYSLRPPAFNDMRTRDMYLDRKPVSLYLVNEYNIAPRRASPCVGWAEVADVTDKNGFISTTPGTSCALLLTSDEVKRISVGEVHINSLKSYEHMGILGATVTAGVAGEDGSCKNSFAADAPVLGSLSIDCLWQERASLITTDIFTFTLPKEINSRTCIFLILAVQESIRDANKVKVMGATFF